MHPNPILFADFPDPDVIRVGDTFYLATTTMHMMPGCDILRSWNLCDWEPVCHVFPALDGTPAQRLEEGSIYGQGMWAPSLRFHDGVFHVLFVANDTHRSYHFTAPAADGPWTEQPITGFYHDPSLFFDDDGRVYIAHGNRRIRLTEMLPDLSGPRPGGFDGIIVQDGPPEDFPLGYEGSHLQKINGRYFLSLIHWPKHGSARRTQALYHADSLHGPWQGGDVLDDDLGFHNRGIAQGGLVDTPDGDWFALLFQDHGAVGRVPVLLPVRWENGLPVFGPVPEAVDPPDLRPGHVYRPLAGDDDFSSPALRDFWQWNHQPDRRLYSLDPAEGTLTLHTGRVVPDLEHAPNTLTQRTFGPRCACEVTVDAADLAEGDHAGLCALQGHFAQINVCRQDSRFFLSVLAKDGEVRESARIPLSGSRVELRAEFDFTDLRDTVHFLWRTAGDWRPLGPAHHLVYDLHHFMGVRAGLFCYATRQKGGRAAFRRFRMHLMQGA